MNAEQIKAIVQNVFNAVADAYDDPALRFFPACARQLADLLDLRGDERVLDVATGTGHVALELAARLPRGRATGVDFSAGMLAQARRKAAARGVANVDFAEMDMLDLRFDDGRFDAARSDPAQAHALINKFSFAPAEVLGEERRRALEAGNRARMERNGSETLARDLAACNAWQDGLAAATRRDCPTLLLCGALDRMTPVKAIGPLHEALRAGGGEVRRVELPGCGHAMQEEDPAAVVRALLWSD